MAKYNWPKRKYMKARKYGGKCEKCGKKAALSEVYQYTDESNGAISWHAPYVCRECYDKLYTQKGA